MNRTLTATYEFETTPLVNFPTGNTEPLVRVASEIMNGLPVGSLGVDTITLGAVVVGTDITNQRRPDDVALAQTVLDSLGGIVAAADVATISLRGITSAARFRAHVAKLQDMADPGVNFHTHYHALQEGARKRIVRPDRGRLAIVLDGDTGFEVANGVIAQPNSGVYSYPSVEQYLQSTRAITAGMLGRKQLITGEDGYFLRGPMDCKLTTSQSIEEASVGQWLYLGPGVVRRVNLQPPTGQLELLVDFNEGQDPFHKSN